MKRLMLVAVTCAALAACRSPAEPADAAGEYAATQVNGHSLPTLIETYTTPDARACNATLVEGVLNLYGERRFDFYLSYRLTCDGNPVVSGNDQTSGSYTQASTLVSFQPQMQGITHFTSGTLSGGTLSIHGVRASGTTLDLVFRKR